MKVLNLYSGLGGNRKHWKNVEVTAVENNPSIAKYYQDQFPNDTVIIADAHQYLLENYKNFDFIWSSINCPTHSRIRYGLGVLTGQVPAVYPDFKLYEEIVFLQKHFDGHWVVENVIPYYKPLIEPTVKIGRHLFWSNFSITPVKIDTVKIKRATLKELQDYHGFDLSGYRLSIDKTKALRNCVCPKIGQYIFNQLKG